MTERKWTPGPWIVVVGSESGHCCFDYAVTSPLKGGCNVVAEVFCGDAPDAHLIAAAPELYDALAMLRGQYVLFVGTDDDIATWALNEVDSALAKARGVK